jgi:hypothetical protein
MGRNARTGELVVLKWWSRGNISRRKTEEQALERLKGCAGVVKLLDKAYDYFHCRTVLVLEYIDGTNGCVLRDTCSTARLRHFFHQLLLVPPSPSLVLRDLLRCVYVRAQHESACVCVCVRTRAGGSSM